MSQCQHPYCGELGSRSLAGGRFCGTHYNRLINERLDNLREKVRRLKADNSRKEDSNEG